jgi:tetratricopeptide (TPR) repeat protein
MSDHFTVLKDRQIDRLLERLSVANDPDDVTDVEMEIWSIWADSGNDAVNMVFEAATMALKDGEPRLAQTLMNCVVELAPRFPEGWNRRATVFILMQNYKAAMKDLNAALALEPRHFGALWSRSLVFEALGETEDALTELQRARDINPHIDGLDERLDYLENGGDPDDWAGDIILG